jgi:cyanophycinase
MTGLLALLGGQEHTPGCEDIDRRLLQDSASATPSVTVVLAATTPRRRAFKSNEASTYWHRLGVDVQFAMNGGPDETERALAALEAPDIVVLTGGHPWLLHARLDGSPVLRRILELRDQGVPLSGSSAGAIAMCEWRQHLQPPRPFQLVRAFGLVRGCAAAPHFDRYGLSRWAAQVGRRYPKLRILGLDDRTALIGRDGEFTVYGSGGVTVLEGRTVTRIPRSGSLELAMVAP